MNELKLITTPDLLISELKRLQTVRKSNKRKSKRKYRITKYDRQRIFSKTGGKCHICGRDIQLSNFEADHLHAHVMGGDSSLENFLPSCSTCNNYKWHYLPDEIQWILKIGIWTRTQIIKDTDLSKQIAKTFVANEINRYKRREVSSKLKKPKDITSLRLIRK